MTNYTNNYQLYKWDKTDEKLTTIQEHSNNADKIETALTNINAAVLEAKSDADAAVTTANNAKNTADGIADTANSAVTTANNAFTTSNNALTTANGAADTANDAQTTANNVQNQFNQVVSQAGSNNPEVVQARGTYDLLGHRLDDFTTQLAQKVTQTDLSNGLASKRDKATKLVMEDMSDTVISAISGNTTVNVLSVPQDGSVTSSKLAADYNYKTQLDNTRDLNEPLDAGVYFISDGSLPLNCPTTHSCVLYQIPIMGYYAIQMVFRFNSDDFLYFRTTFYTSPENNSPWVDLRKVGYNNILDENIIPSKISPASIDYTKLKREFNYNGILDNTFDLNNIASLNTGIYLIQNSSLPANCPTNNTAILINNNYLSSYSTQLILEYTNPSITFSRRVVSGSPADNTPWICNKSLGGKTLLTIGDSITVHLNSTYGYVDKISEMTGATINNQGFSGAKFAMIVNHEPWNDHSFYTYSNTLDLTNIDYLWVSYGTNDFGNNVPMGDTTTDEYTFKGAIYKGLQNFMTRKPTLKILFSVPIFRATFDGTNYADLDTYTNTQGLKMIDYVNAIKDICHQFRVPVFDSWYECGINQFNYQTYLQDMLHPNEEGHKLIGTRFGHFVNRYL